MGPLCIDCKAAVEETRAMVTGEGLVCTSCWDARLLRTGELRANIGARLQRKNVENAFGEATFSPWRRRLGIIVFIVLVAALIVVKLLR